MENQLKTLFPNTQINFALLLAAFIDIPPLPSPSNIIPLSSAMKILQDHNRKFQRGFCMQLKKYILSTFLDLNFLSLTNVQSENNDEQVNWTKIIDTIEIQYHREKLLFDKIESDMITLYEQLDKERRGYTSFQIIISYIHQYDPQSKIIKYPSNFQPSNEVKSKFCNNLHYTIKQEKAYDQKVIQLENLIQLFGRINNQDSITYKTLDSALQDLSQKEYLRLLEKNHKKLKNHQQKHDQNMFQTQFHNTKAIAYRIVNTPTYNMKTVYEKNDYQPEYETIKRKVQHPEGQSSQKTARNELEEKSKNPQNVFYPETHEKNIRLNRGERILLQVDKLLLERVKTRLKLYDIIGL